MKKYYLQIISTFFTATLLVACGGGGGDNAGGNSGITYTGPTSAANISGTNASTLAKTALFSNSTTSVSVFKSGTTNKTDSAIAAMIKTLGHLPRQINLNKSQLTQSSRAVVAPATPIPGSCGGSYTYSFDVNETTGSFTGSLTFSAYCEDVNNVVNGVMTISGTVNVNTVELVSFSMTFNNLTINDAAVSMSFNGTMTVSMPSFNTTLFTMSMDAIDNSGVSVRIENFAVQTIDNGTYETISTSGRFYHSQYGYVDISTLTPMNISLTGDYPYSGIILLTGVNNSRARVTFAAANNYVLEVDADGNGNFELLGNCNWAQSCTPVIR